MARKAYIGIDGTARKATNIYIGVDGVAHKVKAAYVGVDGVAEKFWPKIIPSSYITVTGTSAYSSWKVNNVSSSSTGFYVAPGTTITVICDSAINTGVWYGYATITISYNGSTVVSKRDTKASYTFTVQAGQNYTIAFSGVKSYSGTSGLNRYTVNYTTAAITSNSFSY
ncbi:hypothetical protein KQI82_06350 [Oscillibacter sp. MSJ-2]|uniref:Uncharacterized protein n=1 Tax=Dysosmobacter acutus TaxID=2841504 RepID=A0ABS6F904_9FIRM|nr:hypothetical protein [Dysosmobacter acutus]MBU5626540.1 hypothetical protein [Dysosmobacter acutus]